MKTRYFIVFYTFTTKSWTGSGLINISVESETGKPYLNHEKVISTIKNESSDMPIEGVVPTNILELCKSDYIMWTSDYNNE